MKRYLEKVFCTLRKALYYACLEAIIDGITCIILFLRYNISSPIAKIVGFQDAAVDPVDWPIAPAVGIQSLLSRHSLDATKDIDRWEINEAFAMVVIANSRILGLSEDYQVILMCS